MKISKVVILTQPLNGGNYGGLLQAYALQYTLKTTYKCDAVTDTPLSDRITLRRIAGFSKQYLLNKLILRKLALIKTRKVNSILVAKTYQFVESKINTIEIDHYSDLHTVQAFIVGSDQVWRRPYSNITKSLLGFAYDFDVVRISYAASFGRDDLSEYSRSLLKKSVRLAKKFAAISVREDSGVELVKKYWEIDAEQHVDPTLLLEADHYEKLVQDDSDNVTISNGNLFAYVLDHGEGKGEIINKTSSTLGLKSFEIMPPRAISRKEFFANPAKYQLPPVTQWLKSFMDAEFVVTDSFHGCAFSIIFNKPFIAVGNKERGLARFTSLLKVFGLEDRLVSDAAEVTEELLNSKIDWGRVNGIKKKEQKRSMEYLNRHLKQS